MAKKGIILLITMFFIISITSLYLKNLNDTEKMIKTSQTSYFLNYTPKIIEDMNGFITQLNKKYELYLDENFENFFAMLPTNTFPLEYNNIIINIELSQIDEMCNIHNIYDNNITKRTKCENIFNEQNIDIANFIQNTRQVFMENNSTISNNKQINNIILAFIQRNDNDSLEELSDKLTFIEETNNTKLLKCNFDININEIKVNDIEIVYKLKKDQVEVKDIELNHN